jgi:hypothetical protein
MKTTIYLQALLYIVFAINLSLNTSCTNNQEKSHGTIDTTIGDEKRSISVAITFLDNTTLKIDDFKFQYEWMYEDDKKYLNPPIYTSESDDFHYCKISHGIEIDEIIRRDSISRITFHWPSDIKDGDYRSPDSITISLRDGMGQNIKTDEFEIASTFLFGTSTTNSRSIQFNQLNLIGTGSINDVKGKFISQISMFGANKVKVSECVKEVIF